jgi:putative transposase
MVDTLGLILATKVTSAGIQDRDMVIPLGEKMKKWCPRAITILADSAYEGRQNQATLQLGCLLNITKRPRTKQGTKGIFTVIPKRWVVERTFAWLGCFRRLAVDYEVLPKMSEAFIMISCIVICLKRLA